MIEIIQHGHIHEIRLARPPVNALNFDLLSALASAVEAAPGNGARFVAIADGVWRDAAPAFARTFYIFGDDTLHGARECWVMLGKRGGVERRFWKQQGSKWVEGP